MKTTDGATLPPRDGTTYYEQPLLKKPAWEWEVVTYLFMGGVMGGTAILVSLADEAGDDAELARNGRYLAFVLAAASPAVLIKHLGRPERFLHMLRVVKLKSVMSMGVWALIAFSAVATPGAAAQASRDGLLPKWIARFAPRALTDPVCGLVGAFLAGYTGVLLSATAIPFWAIGKRHIPAISVCSGFASACAANVALLEYSRDPNPVTIRKLERLEAIASLAEGALLWDFRRHAGALAAPMFEGSRGRAFRFFTIACGVVGPTVLGALPFRARWKSLLGATGTLVGGYVLRRTFIDAGKDSADDPRAASRQPE